MLNSTYFKNTPVFPIPTSFTKFGNELDVVEINSYCKYIVDNGAKIIMTTAGTSQYNLLSPEEIQQFNSVISQCGEACIIGLPALSLKYLLEQIQHVNNTIVRKNVAIMLLYPERYYNSESLIEYFHSAANESKYPIFIHGMPIKKATGGMQDYTSEILNEIINHENIVGMKEESSSFELAYELIRKINKKDFITIVAGGSQRRFKLLECVGATSFLAGMGSLFPKLDISYPQLKLENEFFDIFMKYGWHLSMREALRQMHICCSYNRKPFPEATLEQQKNISDVIQILKKHNLETK